MKQEERWKHLLAPAMTDESLVVWLLKATHVVLEWENSIEEPAERDKDAIRKAELIRRIIRQTYPDAR